MFSSSLKQKDSQIDALLMNLYLAVYKVDP